VSVAEHIATERALFVVALDDRDPEKLAALAHAAECALCQRVLREGTAMLQLIDQSDQLAPPAAIDAALEARVRAAVFAAQPERLWIGLEHLAWLLGAVASGLLIWLDGRPDRPLYASLGVRCALMEHGFALVSFAVAMLWTRRAASEYGPLRASVAAMTGALVGQAFLRIDCAAADAALHLLLFHGLGVVVATVLGGLAGRWLSTVRTP
jgi:hypothetical protein